MQEALTIQYWRNQKPEKILHSMFFDRNLFMSLVSAPSAILNAGGAGGRVEEMLKGSHYTIHTFDFNEASMRRGNTLHRVGSYTVADAVQLPYIDGIFDAAVALGLLSILTREQRMATLREIQRVSKKDAYVVISERKRDPQLESIYRQEVKVSGEYGTLPAYSSNGSIEFFAHHFTGDEMCTCLREAGLTPIIVTENYFRSMHSGNIYQGLQVYAKKL